MTSRICKCLHLRDMERKCVNLGLKTANVKISLKKSKYRSPYKIVCTKLLLRLSVLLKKTRSLFHSRFSLEVLFLQLFKCFNCN